MPRSHPQTPQPDTRLGAVLARLEAAFDDHVEELVEWLRIPSVSAQPEHADDVRRAGDWLVDRLERAGLDVRRVETDGHAAVVASWDGAVSAPTLLVYGHYDVQPASLDDGWAHDPFAPVVEGGRIHARGSTDDKGQLLCHVLAAEAWLAETGELPVNLRFVFEGEEEVGSRHFEQVLDRAGDALAADLLIVSDTPMHDEDTPGITLRLRGLVTLQVDIVGPAHDLHSGTWGGVVWNPIEALVHMLASCKDPKTGRVRVDGFYTDVRDADAALRDGLPPLGDDEVLSGTGASATFGESGYDAAQRIGLRPTFEVNGIWGGYTGEGMKTVIPRAAHAKVSCRLVPDQDPDEVAKRVEAHLRTHAPRGVAVTVRDLGHGDWVSADPTHPLVDAVRSALGATWGTEPVLLAEGGSIPAVADMQRRLGVVPVLTGFGNRDENMHAPDETFRLASFRKGRQAAARILAALARTGK